MNDEHCTDDGYVCHTIEVTACFSFIYYDCIDLSA